jgi:hypothetical protein
MESEGRQAPSPGEIGSDGAGDSGRRLTRREFVVALGSVLVVAGYCVVGGRPPDHGPERAVKPGVRPRLRDGLVLGTDAEMLTVAIAAGSSPVYAVNDVGRTILEAMDGRRTVEEIAGVLSQRYAVPADQALQADVALFIAQVAILGLLAEEFRATIFERTSR